MQLQLLTQTHTFVWQCAQPFRRFIVTRPFFQLFSYFFFALQMSHANGKPLAKMPLYGWGW